jgi:hypothetical protein
VWRSLTPHECFFLWCQSTSQVLNFLSIFIFLHSLARICKSGRINCAREISTAARCDYYLACMQIRIISEQTGVRNYIFENSRHSCATFLLFFLGRRADRRKIIKAKQLYHCKARTKTNLLLFVALRDFCICTAAVAIKNARSS